MKKMLEIIKCGKCNHFLPMLCVCSATKGATLAKNEPPSWCPLPDSVPGWRDIADAAGTAATALAESGYDAVEMFRALPEIMEAVDTMRLCYNTHAKIKGLF